jgi:uncharacterized repeat protein (TIGR01451 family)
MRPAIYYETGHLDPDKSNSPSARRQTVLGLSFSRGRVIRVAAFFVVIAAVLMVLQTSHAGRAERRTTTPAVTAVSSPTAPSATRRPVNGNTLSFLAMPFQATTESIQTFASDCQTPKDAFTLGETVCVKATVPFTFLLGLRAINIVGPANVVRDSAIITSLSQTHSFTLPTTDQTTIGDQTFDNRGTWRADLATLTGARRASAFFDVSAPNAEAADLQIVASVDRTTVPTGGTLEVTVFVLNFGPDSAENVIVTPPSHPGLTLQSFIKTSDNSSCDEPCTIPILGRHGSASFIATYDVTAADGTVITARASVTSDTEDPRPTFDYVVDENNPAPPANTNVTTINVLVNAGGNQTEACVLTCPANVVATANTTVSGQFGAIVNYGAASSEGDCGTVTNSPVSGTFFAVGTHTVTSSSETGGGSCTFTVKVLDTPAPTITCPANQSVTDTDSSGEETVNVGTPTFTASGGGTTSGVRSDSTQEVPKTLTDPFPTGITSILWTVTDADGRTATCTQTITVVDAACANDTEAPTIEAPADLTINTGAGATSCSITLDDELGQPEVHDNCTVSFTVSGMPAGNHFAPGTYTLTYTATDGAGNTASDTQTVTVVETTAPIIFAPADASYTCLTEVPAANASQARGPALDPSGIPLIDDDGNYIQGTGAPFDNCGIPTVTVTETSTGQGTAANPKIIHRTFTATDASGNSSSDVQIITVTDGTAPAISCPADITVYLPMNSTATSTVVNYTAPVGTDNCANATTTQTAGLASGASFPVGTTTNTFRVTDAVGNTAECSFTVTVLYNFSGFFQPVDNLPTFNTVQAGKAIPVKFSLSGNKGLNIFVVGTPDSQQIACDSGAPVAEIEDTVNAGSSSLSYDATTDQYIYVWKTSNSWAGTCRKLIITLNDGTTHIAYFKFR